MITPTIKAMPVETPIVQPTTTRVLALESDSPDGTVTAVAVLDGAFAGLLEGVVFGLVFIAGLKFEEVVAVEVLLVVLVDDAAKLHVVAERFGS